MSNDASQPTLHDRHDSSLVERVEGLGLVDLAALAAFEAARDDPAPISPTLRLTFELAARLRRAGILELLEVVPRAPAWGQARAIYDPIAWTYLSESPELGVLRQLVARTLEHRRSEGAEADALWLWRNLANAELESYFAHLLRRHHMETTWARNLVDRTEPELDELCLAQRRALAWNGMKEGAAAFLRSKGDSKQCLDGIVSEIRRQARWMRRHQPAASGWIPSPDWRQPLLLRTFLEVYPLAHRYWTELPSTVAVETCR